MARDPPVLEDGHPARDPRDRLVQHPGLHRPARNDRHERDPAQLGLPRLHPGDLLRHPEPDGDLPPVRRDRGVAARGRDDRLPRVPRDAARPLVQPGGHVGAHRGALLGVLHHPAEAAARGGPPARPAQRADGDRRDVPRAAVRLGDLPRDAGHARRRHDRDPALPRASRVARRVHFLEPGGGGTRREPRGGVPAPDARVRLAAGGPAAGRIVPVLPRGRHRPDPGGGHAGRRLLARAAPRATPRKETADPYPSPGHLSPHVPHGPSSSSSFSFSCSGPFAARRSSSSRSATFR